MSGRLSSCVILINKIARWQKSPWAPGSSLPEPLLRLISLVRIPLSPSTRAAWIPLGNESLGWNKHLSDTFRLHGWCLVGGAHLVNVVFLFSLASWGNTWASGRRYMGEKQSSLMRETEGGEGFYVLRDGIFLCKHLASHFVLRAEQRQLYFWLSFHFFFSLLVLSILHFFYLFCTLLGRLL